MNKMILIVVGVLMVVGISYQAKRSYDSHHASNTSGTPGQNGVTGTDNVPGATNGTTAQTGQNGTDGAGTAGVNGTNGQGANGVGTSGTNGAGGTATTGTTGANGTGTAVATKPVPEKPKDNCFAFEYRHKKEARDQDIENFLDYTNAFPLPANYNPKSLCVKVNQKAVNFQLAKFKTTPEVRVGSMVGPESVIRVSYCVGKITQCHEKCDQPKKRFMDDLMSDATDEDSFNDSWGKEGDENHKKEIKAKAKELRTIASENDHLNEGSVQRDWEELQKQETYCK
jgi:hypothetical protein